MFKKILKWVAIIIGVILLLLIIVGLIMNESKPSGQAGNEADALANKMLAAVDKQAWDSTRYVRWTFAGMHDYTWDKERHFVSVRWKDNEVLLHTKSVKGKAFVSGSEVTGEEADKLVQKAWEYFCNDSFWLNAPAKAFDPGTSRSLVTLDDGGTGVMVTYSSGGVTPGDSYLWILDENGLPTAWKMWVKIIPIGGVETSWEDWQTLSTGAKIATSHQSTGLNLQLTKIKGGMNWSDVDVEKDPFEGM